MWGGGLIQTFIVKCGVRPTSIVLSHSCMRVSIVSHWRATPHISSLLLNTLTCVSGLALAVGHRWQLQCREYQWNRWVLFQHWLPFADLCPLQRIQRKGQTLTRSWCQHLCDSSCLLCGGSCVLSPASGIFLKCFVLKVWCRICSIGLPPAGTSAWPYRSVAFHSPAFSSRQHFVWSMQKRLSSLRWQAQDAHFQKKGSDRRTCLALVFIFILLTRMQQERDRL